MPDKYVIQRRTASGLENVAELPALENGKIDLSWLPVVGSMGSAIIERGSNANGEYIRWADGTQVCVSAQVTVQAGGLGQNYGVTVNHPAAFTSALISVISTVGSSSGSLEAIGNFYANGPNIKATATYTSVVFYSYKGDIANDIYIKLLTIGRWK